MVDCITIPLIIPEIILWIACVILLFITRREIKNHNLLGYVSFIPISVMMILLAFTMSGINGRFDFINEFIKTLPCIVWVK